MGLSYGSAGSCRKPQNPLCSGACSGGGSSINAEVFTRGVAQDYDRWANEEGCKGWAFKDVQPYFLRSEGNEIFATEYHGTEGPLGVSSLLNPMPVTKAFVQACQQYGIPYNPDFNGAAQEGAGCIKQPPVIRADAPRLWGICARLCTVLICRWKQAV